MNIGRSWIAVGSLGVSDLQIHPVSFDFVNPSVLPGFTNWIWTNLDSKWLPGYVWFTNGIWRWLIYKSILFRLILLVSMSYLGLQMVFVCVWLQSICKDWFTNFICSRWITNFNWKEMEFAFPIWARLIYKWMIGYAWFTNGSLGVSDLQIHIGIYVWCIYLCIYLCVYLPVYLLFVNY